MVVSIDFDRSSWTRSGRWRWDSTELEHCRGPGPEWWGTTGSWSKHRRIKFNIENSSKLYCNKLEQFQNWITQIESEHRHRYFQKNIENSCSHKSNFVANFFCMIKQWKNYENLRSSIFVSNSIFARQFWRIQRNFNIFLLNFAFSTLSWLKLVSIADA